MKRILCYVGLHHWQTFSIASYSAIGRKFSVVSRCHRCSARRHRWEVLAPL